MRKFLVAPVVLAMMLVASVSLAVDPEAEALAAKLQAAALEQAVGEAKIDSNAAFVLMFGVDDVAVAAEAACMNEDWRLLGDWHYDEGEELRAPMSVLSGEGSFQYGGVMPFTGGRLDEDNGLNHFDVSEWVEAKEDFDKAIVHYEAALVAYLAAEPLAITAALHYVDATTDYEGGHGTHAEADEAGGAAIDKKDDAIAQAEIMEAADYDASLAKSDAWSQRYYCTDQTYLDLGDVYFGVANDYFTSGDVDFIFGDIEMTSGDIVYTQGLDDYLVPDYAAATVHWDTLIVPFVGDYWRAEGLYLTATNSYDNAEFWYEQAEAAWALGSP